MNAYETDDELKKRAPKRKKTATSDITSSLTLKRASTAEATTPKTSPVNTEPSAPLLFPSQSKEGHDEEGNPPRGESNEQQQAAAAGSIAQDLEVKIDYSQGVEVAEYHVRRLSDDKVKLESLSTRVKLGLSNVGLDDPAALLVWNVDNVNAAVVHLNAAAAVNANAMVPAWLGGGAFPITPSGFMQAIATRVGAQGGGVIGNALIAPNSYQQYANVKTLMYALGLDPLLSTLPANVLPLARNFSFGDRMAQTTGASDPVLAPPAPGVAAIL